MKKEDLKNGYVVETRIGGIYLIVDNTLINLDTHGFTDLCDYSDKMKCIGCKDLDIMKVMVCNSPNKNKAIKDVEYRKPWSWVRKEIELSCDEKAILRNLPKEYNYIARDKNGTLAIYRTRPDKECTFWTSGNGNNLHFFNNLFSFIKWEDEEPYLISDLLGE